MALAVPTSRFMQMEPGPSSYGVTPLDFAPDPGRIARAWFSSDLIDRNLEALASGQQRDGGWPLTWDPPSEAARWEWRGIRTLSALRILAAYGHIEGPTPA